MMISDSSPQKKKDRVIMDNNLYYLHELFLLEKEMQPTPVLLPEKYHGAWWVTVLRVAKSQTHLATEHTSVGDFYSSVYILAYLFSVTIKEKYTFY